MVGWHHQLDAHKFEQAPEVGALQTENTKIAFPGLYSLRAPS